ncbi:MAG: ABC transporter permease [Calditrichaeota bacterium]|nr:ABC transporter permease [Calditrichota bacterium]MCB9365844.1 ABC transporter permease [Calditrichota bacterium]
MLLRMALRDLLKMRKRSLAVIAVVAVSVFLLQFGGSYVDGFKDKIQQQTVRESGDLRIAAKGYDEKIDLLPLEPNVAWTKEFADSLAALPDAKRVRPMLKYGALANSLDRTLEMQLAGTTPGAARAIWGRLERSVTDGAFLDGANQVMLGTRSAELLNVRAGDKIILLTNDVYGGMSAVEPVVRGVFRSLNEDEDATLVLCELGTLQKLVGLDGRVTGVTVELTDHSRLDAALVAARERFGKEYQVTSWKEDQAALIQLLDVSEIGIWVITLIILIVASLGMINTFLISILERLREFGTLRAVGLLPTQLIRMVLFQGLVLGIIGTVVGLIISVPITFYYYFHPIDLGEAMQGLEGVDSLIWLTFVPETTIKIGLLGVLISIFASVYPAYWASRKQPVEILRELG